MKKILLLIFIYSVKTSFAQFTINGPVDTGLGDSTKEYTNAIKLNPGNAGSNVTWDFSKVPFTDSIVTVYKSFQTAPSQADFPTQNLITNAYTIDPVTAALSPSSTFGFFKTEMNRYYSLGTYTDSNGTKSTLIYDLPGRLVENLPKTYLSVNTFSHNGIVKAEGGLVPFPVTLYRKGKGVETVDAWGKIKLPGQTTYKNCMRVKTISSYTDSTFTFGFNILIQYTEESYSYIIENEDDDFNIEKTSTTTFLNGTKDGTDSSFSITYSKSLNRMPLSIEEQLMSAELKIFPVPAKDFIIISNSSSHIYPYSCKDLSGRVLLEGKTHENETRIEISGLDPGMYFIEIGAEKKRITRLIKE